MLNGPPRCPLFFILYFESPQGHRPSTHLLAGNNLKELSGSLLLIHSSLPFTKYFSASKCHHASVSPRDQNHFLSIYVELYKQLSNKSMKAFCLSMFNFRNFRARKRLKNHSIYLSLESGEKMIDFPKSIYLMCQSPGYRVDFWMPVPCSLHLRAPVSISPVWVISPNSWQVQDMDDRESTDCKPNESTVKCG